MTMGVGGSTQGAEFERLRALRRDVEPIGDVERRARIAKAQLLMREQGVHALYLGSSSSMFYFTGVQFNPTERLHGALIPQEGDLVYLSPAFEEAKLRAMMSLPGKVRCWEEHEDPTALVVDVARDMGYASGVMGVDPSTPFFTFDGLRRAGNSYDFVNGNAVIAQCRMIKSGAEIALIKRAMELTLEIQRSAASILREGVVTTEISDFIKQAHTVAGFDAPPNFAMVLFGEPTAYPHGVPYPQTLKNGDMVLIDVGAKLKGYQSDITRSYVFGEPSRRQREIWNVEKEATEAVFAAAQIGATCESLDAAARKVLEASGLGPGYALPGLPHRTGHGVGLDVHEEPYIVRGDRTKLAAGMCFSNEPTICLYGEFGVRLEDHICMTDAGPEWFTTPSPSIDDPFGRQT